MYEHLRPDFESYNLLNKREEEILSPDIDTREDLIDIQEDNRPDEEPTTEVIENNDEKVIPNEEL